MKRRTDYAKLDGALSFDPGAVVVGRELTKLHEEYLRDTWKLSVYLPLWSRGENLLAVAGAEPSVRAGAGPWQVAEQYLQEGLSTRRRTKAAQATGYARNELYRYLIEKKKRVGCCTQCFSVCAFDTLSNYISRRFLLTANSLMQSLQTMRPL